MRENGREEEKRENWSPSRQKFIHWKKKNLLLQCLQMAYIATKARKITKLHELSLLQKGVIWEANKKKITKESKRANGKQQVKDEQ